LDVALEWEGDNALHGKQAMSATAGEDDRAVVPRAMAGDGQLPAGIPAKARALFRKPVVAVNPGVGAIMRQ
jgi:hypothetical protein